MIPPGYSYPAASQNATISAGYALIAKLAKLGRSASLAVQPFGSAQGPNTISIDDAHAAGVTDSDPVSLVVLGLNEDPQQASVLISLMSQAAQPGMTIAALMEFAAGVFPTQDAAHVVLSLIASNPPTIATLASQLM
jgi:hypothetical protein